jgi:hypothetical protein
MQRITEFIKTLTGETRLPKSMRAMLKKHGDKNIVSIEVNRTPLSAGARTFSNLLSLGKFSEIEKKYYDKFFHLYAILVLEDNTELLYEKNETPVLYTTIPKKTQETESIYFNLDPLLPLAQFVQKHIDKMGLPDYMRYTPTSLNCQNFILNALKANNLNDTEKEKFIYQDLTKLIEETPSFSKWLAQKTTDLAGAISRPIEELFYKRGGKVSHRKRRIGHF